ncbi:MAG: hypothetical protein VXY92_03940, partial [Planctomycetota bacterium]|nr:hypothetical protein [Planctomycetota bacterium]
MTRQRPSFVTLPHDHRRASCEPRALVRRERELVETRREARDPSFHGGVRRYEGAVFGDRGDRVGHALSWNVSRH